MRDKPQGCYLSSCPLAVICTCHHNLTLHPSDGACTHEGCHCREFWSKGKGFVLGSGDPSTAQLAIMLEAPGHEEIAFSLERTQEWGYFSEYANCKHEVELRLRDYPDISITLSKKGAPVVGKSGGELFTWVPMMKRVSRGDIFLDNTLRCLAPKEGKSDSAYPTGPERKRAEGCCRQYDRWGTFLRGNGAKLPVVIVSMHPAGILRDVTPLRLQAKNFEKAATLLREGHQVLVLAGGKAAKLWLGYGENVTRWQGHFQFESEGVGKRRAERFAEYATVDYEKRPKGGKLRTGEKVEKAQQRRRDKDAAKKAVRVRKEVGIDVIAVASGVKPNTRKRKHEEGKSKGEQMREFAVEDPMMGSYWGGKGDDTRNNQGV